MSSKPKISLPSIYHHDKSLVLRDGFELKARLWEPNQTGPWPVLLMRQPYGKEIASTITYPHPVWWASHGFLVIVQDVRGQGSSGGTFKGFQQEASDTSETLKWVRSLESCNGRIGTYGFSYQGFTQLIAEPGTIPPDCLVPIMTGLNEKDHWSCEGGAFWWELGIRWGLQLAAQKVKRENNLDAWIAIRESLEKGFYLREGPNLLHKYDPEGMALKWLKKSESGNEQWPIHKPLKTWLKKPMLLIGGWWDPHLKGILDLYAKSIKEGGSPEIHIGPASHLEWWEGVQSLQLNFFKKHLLLKKDTKNKDPKPFIWNITTKAWEENINSEVRDLNWGLKTKGLACLDTSDGLLEADSKNSSGLLTLVNDPWRPTPSIGGHLGPNPGLVNRYSVDRRTDVATFTSLDFRNPIKLVGIPVLEINANSDQESFDLCVSLSIVNKERNIVTQLSTGVLRINNLEAKKMLPRKVYLQPILADFQKDTSLRISISASAWPAIGVNPGLLNQPCGAPAPHCLVTTISFNLEGAKLEFASLITK